MKDIVAKLSALVPALALIIGVISANSACVTFFYQPETPAELNKYRK